MSAQEHSKLIISETEAQEIENVYDGLLERIMGLSGKTDTEAVGEAIGELLDFIIERLSSQGESLLLYTSKVFDKYYIFAHSLNVCLISIRIGLRLNFDKERLKEVGFLALTHAQKDMGFPEQPLDRVKHDQKMDEIIRLADVYDALTHPPAYRHAMIPNQTLAAIIDSDKLFERGLTKILIEELSFYPKGSWVQLSSKEIGRVTKINQGLILRPMVTVFFDWQGRYLEEPKRVDLSQDNCIYVTRPLAGNHIPVENIGMA